MNLNNKQTGPTIMVIFGGSGDLAYRKLAPALYNLYLGEWLPEKFVMIGNGRTQMSDDEYRDSLKKGIEDFSRSPLDESVWHKFSQSIHYICGDLNDEQLYKQIDETLCGIESKWQTETQRLFYLSVAPRFVEPIAIQLGKSQVCADIERSRLVIEKPFGHDLNSARQLNHMLLGIFQESQLYRIDHYLGKEPVQNLLAFRFANTLFEPLWNRQYIDHIEITVAEDIGIGSRGGYYDQSGALKDMVQNHLFQLLCMVAMEPPLKFDANEIRDKKIEVLNAVRPYTTDSVAKNVARGQYTAGKLHGEIVKGYLQENEIPADSKTETFVALKMWIDNWRWHGVPFFLRTGKRMPRKQSFILIQFSPVPHKAFTDNEGKQLEPNKLLIHIQPESDIRLYFYAKQPGLSMSLNHVDMRFDYHSNFEESTPEAYETLLLDAMVGNPALYMRADQVEKAWELIMPVLEYWESSSLNESNMYGPGSWGPAAAEQLLFQEGRTWWNPSNTQ